MSTYVPPEAPLPKWVSPSQASGITNMSTKTIYRRIQEGTLPAVRFGPRCIRIKLDDVLKLLSPITPEGQQNAAPERG